MTVLGIVILLVVAAICGALAQGITGYSSGGLFVSIALGFIGALLGHWMATNLGLPELFTLDIEGVPFPIIWSIIGATLFVAVVGFLSRRPTAP